MMSTVERKVLGALFILSDDERYVKGVTQVRISHAMGYAKSGGAVSNALRMLEMMNYIVIVKRGTLYDIKVLV